MSAQLSIHAVELAADSLENAIQQLGMAHSDLESLGELAHRNAVDMQISALQRRLNILRKIVRDLTE